MLTDKQRVATLRYGLTIAKIRAQKIKTLVEPESQIGQTCDSIIRAIDEALEIAEK